MGLFSALPGNAGVAHPDEVKKDYGMLLAEGETIEIGFKLIRDVFFVPNGSPSQTPAA